MGTTPVAEAQFESCYARLREDTFVLGNRLIERTWTLREGKLHASGLLDKLSGRQWISRASDQPSLIAASAPPAASLRLIPAVQRHPVSRPALQVTLSADDGQTGYAFRIFPNSAGIEMHLLSASIAPRAEAAGAAHALQPSGVEQDAPAAAEPSSLITDVVDHFHLDPLHLRLIAVTLVDQTDSHNNLVAEREWLLAPTEHTIAARGNVFIFEHTLSQAGLILLRLAPLPHARPIGNDTDLLVRNSGAVSLLGHGTGPDGGAGYPAVAIPYQGGRAGRIAALQHYQRQLRPYQPERDGQLLSNTWGDRSRDARINADFVALEIEAGQKLGVDVVQIDDGWQRGITANSVHREKGGVWNGFWAADPHFWEHHPQRFAKGLKPTIDRALGAGMQMGLWFAPDSSNDFANWKRDADAILQLHRAYGVNYIKIDGVKAHTKAGERNLRRFFDAVLEASAGKVVFDLDVTAEIRPGYFGMPDVGPIFVENRYTDWHRYWPHATLRNLWTLAQYVDPLRLRIEFLNNTRHADKYAGDPLAPAGYPPDYLFASVMFASPLGWFEVSNLPPDYVARVAPLVKVWKEHRDGIFGGTILPIGAPPDGTQWTGFASLSPGGSGGYAVIFRELNDQAEWTLPQSQLSRPLRDLRTLAGDGHAVINAGQLHIHLTSPLRYLFVQFT
jgi:alpha-galactosidase